MFEIGFWELALIAALGLIVLGPEKLPRVAAQLGRYAGQARRMARMLTAQVREELEAEERRLNAAAAASASPSAQAAPEFNRPGAADLIPGDTPPDETAGTTEAAAGGDPAAGATQETPPDRTHPRQHP